MIFPFSETQAGLEVSPERNSSSGTQNDMNVMENDDQQCVEEDIQYVTDTDRQQDLPPNNEDIGLEMRMF